MDKRYNHAKCEKDIYKKWEDSDTFTPIIKKSKKPFTIIMPPPNANDDLHIGHARFVTIQDILIRFHRMRGIPTLWLPGADHAGIETQFVFEKRLREKGKSRFDYNQQTLYKMIYDHVINYTSQMQNQLRALGASCDWSRHKFTLDKDIVKIVYKTFKHLYDDGLIYRGERIVNYCPHCGTSFSELEVNYKQTDGYLYYLDYKIIKLATTRPETIFADTAVAVNPKDKRYKSFVGKNATIPLIGRQIPIIKDSLVEKDFGTGVLKVTPAHDSTDFEIGQKHNLATISVIDESGRLINTPPKYIGMKTKKAREEVVKDLKKEGFLVKTKKITHPVGHCYRCKGVIEPTIQKQWFLKVKPLVDQSLKAIKEKKVRFTAKKFEKVAKHWYKNLKDWNISRQIVWGIRIPAFRCKKCLSWTVTDGKKPKKCKCGNTKLVQDTDTFDTWFSSSQWPFATLKSGEPKDFDYFYPTSVMNTAYDILPFWVIRMIMLGLYETKKVPFKDVLIYGLVRDKNGEKISKSKGNVVNPLQMTEKYGADALRMALVWGTLIENDISLSEENIRGQRNFANKLWNIARFITISFDKYKKAVPAYPKGIRGKLKKEDKNILGLTEKVSKEITKDLEKYRLSEASEKLYQFVWNDLANTYLEKTKDRKDKEVVLSVLKHVFITSLKLAHPFMPFVTESIWSELKDLRKQPNQLLISALWPTK